MNLAYLLVFINWNTIWNKKENFDHLQRESFNIINWTCYILKYQYQSSSFQMQV